MTLQAKHHWCLTGTPISNKVEDLGALLQFCRVPLLKNQSCFREHITRVAKRSFSQGCSVLRQTLSPFCLRRTRALLDIPPPRTVESTVELSAAERERYQELVSYCKRKLDQSVSLRGNASGRHTMLHAILQLRIFCNHGTYMHIPEQDAEEHLDPDEALTLLEENGEAYCARCSDAVHLINQLDDPGSGMLGTCSDLLCASCFDNALDGQDRQSSYLCPVCRQCVSREILPIDRHPAAGTGRIDHEHSAKLQRLVENLSQTHLREKR